MLRCHAKLVFAAVARQIRGFFTTSSSLSIQCTSCERLSANNFSSSNWAKCADRMTALVIDGYVISLFFSVKVR